MPNKKEYPKWFNINAKPHQPIKPMPIIIGYEELGNGTACYEHVTIPQGATDVYLEYIPADDPRYGVPTVGYVFTRDNEQPDPNYTNRLKAYHRQLKKYEKRIVEWNAYAKKWRKEKMA